MACSMNAYWLRQGGPGQVRGQVRLASGSCELHSHHPQRRQRRRHTPLPPAGTSPESSAQRVPHKGEHGIGLPLVQQLGHEAGVPQGLQHIQGGGLVRALPPRAKVVRHAVPRILGTPAGRERTSRYLPTKRAAGARLYKPTDLASRLSSRRTPPHLRKINRYSSFHKICIAGSMMKGGTCRPAAARHLACPLFSGVAGSGRQCRAPAALSAHRAQWGWAGLGPSQPLLLPLLRQGGTCGCLALSSEAGW